MNCLRLRLFLSFISDKMNSMFFMSLIHKSLRQRSRSIGIVEFSRKLDDSSVRSFSSDAPSPARGHDETRLLRELCAKIRDVKLLLSINVH